MAAGDLSVDDVSPSSLSAMMTIPTAVVRLGGMCLDAATTATPSYVMCSMLCSFIMSNMFHFFVDALQLVFRCHETFEPIQTDII